MTARILDDTLLADPRALAALDTGKVLWAAATAGAQIRSAAEGAAEAGISRLAGMRPRALVLLRRPGASTSAAGILSALLGTAGPVPVVPADTAPSWIGPLDVLVAHTADPADVELADAVARAVGRGAEVVLSAPSGGPVVAAGAGRVCLVEPRIPVPPGFDLPRALVAGLATACELGLLATPPESGFDEIADVLDAEAERNQPGHEPFMNPAKSLALRLAEHTPLLWGTDALAGAVAEHAAVTLATHAGVVAHAAELGRAATATALHRALDRADAQRDVFHDPVADTADPSAGPPLRLVLLAADEEDPNQIAVRRTGRSRPSSDVLHPVEEIPRGTRNATLLRAVLLGSRFDAAAAYLGLAIRAIEPA